MILITEFDSSQFEKCSRSSQIRDQDKPAQNYKLQSVYLWSCISKKRDTEFFLYCFSVFYEETTPTLFLSVKKSF